MKYGILGIIVLILCSLTIFADDSKISDKPKIETYPPYYNCVTDPNLWVMTNPEETRKRFDIYKEIGVDMVRVVPTWELCEIEEGKWDISPYTNYMKIAKEYGFKIKVVLGVIMQPPKWFLAKHPEAFQKDEEGNVSYFSISYSFPELKKIVGEKNKKLVELMKEEGVWDDVIYVVPTFGPAGEPIYPHPWTLTYIEDYGEPKYWGYEEAGQKDFAKSMKAKYENIDLANKAWNTDFKNWDDVIIFKSGEKPGTYWNDYLVWYRNRKQDFIKWEIGNLREIAPEKITLVYVPGTAFTQAEWDDAVVTAQGHMTIKMMCDSMELMTEAYRQGAWLQYTGSENAPEVARLCKYLKDNNMGDMIMWGENAGYPRAAKDPVNLANIIIENGLYGIDYTPTNFAFTLKDGKEMPDVDNPELYTLKPDEVVPDPEIIKELKKAFTMIKEYNAKTKRTKK